MKYLLLFFTFLLHLNIFSQTDLKLSDYKLADYKRHLLNFNVNLTGLDFQSGYDNNQSHQSSNQFNTSIYHGFYKNTRKYQGVQSGNFGISYNNSKQENSFSSQSDFLTTSLEYSSENRFYNSRNWFLEASPYLLARHDKIEFNQQDSSYNSKQNSLNSSLKVGAGIGRIERVEDYRLAIFLNDVLTSSGQLKNLNEQELLELASKITKLKNRRFYDHRLQRIYEIESLDSLFTQFGKAQNNNAVFYSRLYDYWLYAQNPVRESGFRIDLSFINSYNSFETNIKANGDSTSINRNNSYSTFIAQPQLSLYYALPFHLNWQFTTGITTYYSANINNFQDVSSYTLSSELYAALAFYPNTRSFIDLRLDYDYQNRFYSNGMIEQNQLNTQINGYYYLSPQLRLRMYYRYSLGLSPANEYQDTFKSTNHEYGVLFTYMIF